MWSFRAELFLRHNAWLSWLGPPFAMFRDISVFLSLATPADRRVEKNNCANFGRGFKIFSDVLGRF